MNTAWAEKSNARDRRREFGVGEGEKAVVNRVGSGGAQFVGGVGAGGDGIAGEAGGAGGLHIPRGVADEAGGGGVGAEGGEGVGGELGLRFQPLGVGGAEHEFKKGCEAEVVADGAGGGAVLVGEDGAGDAVGVESREEFAGAGEGVHAFEQVGGPEGAVEAEAFGHLRLGDKCAHGVFQAAADGVFNLFAGGRGQPELRQCVGVAAMDGGQVVDQGAIEIEEDGAETHGRKLAAGRRANDTKFAFLPATGTLNPLVMSEPTVTPPETRVLLHPKDEELLVELQGSWRITATRPSWVALLGGSAPKRVKFVWGALETWDSALLLFVFEVRQWCRVKGIYCDLSCMPEAMQKLLGQLVVVNETRMTVDRSKDFVTVVGVAAQDVWAKTQEIATFVGECVISAGNLLKLPRKFRWRDCLEEMQRCGAMALPIVSLISLLTGLIMAYQSAILMRQFGADIYVADAVGLVMVREMGAMMTAIILAGRTGAAFAATLGNMKAGEEIDALTTLGIRPVDFLVMPRILALAVMMPLLALYANGLGILGGMAVSLGVLHIPPSAYWIETQTAIDLSDVATGLIKASAFGVLVGLAGCHCGLRAERSAAGVGNATTSAVVMGLLLIIVFDALFAVIFSIFGL